MKIFKYLLIISLITLVQTIKSQESYAPEDVVDEKFGIIKYEPLNIMLGKDSIRNDARGYAANGYIEDYYKSGQLLHKGFYVDGQLKVYKNYFPNGKVERNFRLTDIKKSKMTIYYADGKIKSEIEYIENQAVKWQDFYPNGNPEFVEEYDKNIQYYVFKANYFENGTPENTLTLTDKKKLILKQIYYHANGQLKEEGEMKYNKSIFDYERIGTWTLFDETGKPTKKVKYASGKVVSENDL
ncbi:MAG: hypothetical protein COW67_06800 [Flavobacteriales bacterium CG18_big_fil_WC_8_21_14_2_50_32_9]|nr:MAG: hypothetical protein COW67_06800 [Flavobacteriales bacterium CG18_big_fil_WC_8_21_14_2_50_32_9]